MVVVDLSSLHEVAIHKRYRKLLITGIHYCIYYYAK